MLITARRPQLTAFTAFIALTSGLVFPLSHTANALREFKFRREEYNALMNHRVPGILILFVFFALSNLFGQTTSGSVTAPPDSFFQKVRERDREAARQFYKKYIEVKGLPVAAAGEVADAALERTSDVVTHMLAGRPDVLQAMVSNV